MRHGAETLHRLAAAAVGRMLARGLGPAAGASLFTEGELAELADALAATLATAELLGRSLVRDWWRRVEERHGGDSLDVGRQPGGARDAEAVPRRLPEGVPGAGLSSPPVGELSPLHEDLTAPPSPLPPEAALAHFASLVPRLGVDPDRFGPDLRRRAFTLAVATDRELLDRVHAAVLAGLEGGTGVPTGENSVEKILDAAGVTPANPQYCFLPGARVEGAVLAASRAWFDGPAVQLETDDGRTISVTVNHPVMTAAGWKEAGSVEVGEQLVCYGRPVESFHAPAGATEGRAVHNDQIPPRIEDVFEALAEQGAAWLDVERPVAPLDFYGDAAFFEGQVHRVRANRVLVDGPDAYRRQLGEQIQLVPGNVPAANSPGVRSGLLDLRRQGPTHAALRCGEVPQAAGLHVRWDFLPEDSVLLGPSAHLNPNLFKATAKRPGGDAQLASELVQRLPGTVSLRRVVKVQRIAWTGHVYDLQTATGFIVSQGIVTGNCEMVFRTNAMDAYNQGTDDERRAPDVVATLPVWQYLAVVDSRSRPEHAAKHGNYYPAAVPFAAVRGTTPDQLCNCRCTQIPIDRWAWARLRAAGARIAAPYADM